MERSHRDVLLADLLGKFELLLEDHAALHAEMQALRREVHERQELAQFLLKTIAADLAAHRADQSLHPRCRPHAAWRSGRHPAQPRPAHPPS